MTSEVLTILPLQSETNYKKAHIPFIGKKTLDLVSSLPVDETGKQILISEACDILSHCVFPSDPEENTTSIAVGYVQSGKTMSFTVLSSLAADNGFKVIIYLTGTKTNLQQQTYKRLKDTFIKGVDSDYVVFEDDLACNSVSINRIRNFLSFDDYVLMFPILKHHKHIGTLADIFDSTSIKQLLNNKSVLIIDDEADQSSFNTYAKANSIKSSHGTVKVDELEFSSTYESIIKLRSSFKRHSYVQYTATPQAAFLIDNNDILSPKYHTVLTPGDGYTGGLFFFKNPSRQYVEIVPEDEVYHMDNNPLTTLPKSLEKSLKEFLISVAIKVIILKEEKFLSMMVHIDGRTDTNEKFCKWISAKLNRWIECISKPLNDPAYSMLIASFKPEYHSITKYVDNPPSYEEIVSVLRKTMLMTNVRLIQGKMSSSYNVTKGEIDWESSPANILVGADMLNRGFTVEKLSMTYMPRTTKNKSNADTIEQRCRFFGYKKRYSDICRIYLSQKSKEEYETYVEHEELLRKNLKQCKDMAEFVKMSKSMILTNRLNPTRTNILSSKIVRNSLVGWKQLISVDHLEYNANWIDNMLKSIDPSKFVLCQDYNGNVVRNHRYIDIEIESFIEFFRNVRYIDLANIVRKSLTIQYLHYLKDNGYINYIRMYEIAYMAKDQMLRSHKLKANNIIPNLMFGYAENGSYPGDKHFKTEDTICFQIHKYKIDSKGYLGNKIAYNLTVYYPEQFGADYISMNSLEEE